MADFVVVFDFDKTIIDCDSDNWVVDTLGCSQIFNQLLPTMPWNSVMDAMMGEFHAQGKTVKDIEEVLKIAPMQTGIISAIKTAHARGCELRIVSDANSFFIETILEHHGLRKCFSEINTNPSYVDEEGRLRIFPYHDFKKCSHGCSLCPPNMCKGFIIERIQNSVSEKEGRRFIYLGDGSGDYCPSLKLGEKDYVMPRTNFPLWHLICENRAMIKAGVHEWTDGEELERILICLIGAIDAEEDGFQLNVSVDCKLQTISSFAHDALPQALSVPH